SGFSEISKDQHSAGRLEQKKGQKHTATNLLRLKIKAEPTEFFEFSSQKKTIEFRINQLGRSNVSRCVMEIK
ncbi:MAG TPA: hypothetical protein DIT20_00150, partial [Sutterellaceae bacterium]|nr:hypothetical protein [Sutterellaceae bacterium]